MSKQNQKHWQKTPKDSPRIVYKTFSHPCTQAKKIPSAILKLVLFLFLILCQAYFLFRLLCVWFVLICCTFIILCVFIFCIFIVLFTLFCKPKRQKPLLSFFRHRGHVIDNVNLHSSDAWFKLTFIQTLHWPRVNFLLISIPITMNFDPDHDIFRSRVNRMSKFSRSRKCELLWNFGRKIEILVANATVWVATWSSVMWKILGYKRTE